MALEVAGQEMLKPPAVLWFVTPERVRAGLPPMKLKPTAYANSYTSEGKPVWVITGRKRASGRDVLYALSHCHEALSAAQDMVARFAIREAGKAACKLQELNARLSKARAAAEALTDD